MPPVYAANGDNVSPEVVEVVSGLADLAFGCASGPLNWLYLSMLLQFQNLLRSRREAVPNTPTIRPLGGTFLITNAPDIILREYPTESEHPLFDARGVRSRRVLDLPMCCTYIESWRRPSSRATSEYVENMRTILSFLLTVTLLHASTHVLTNAVFNHRLTPKGLGEDDDGKSGESGRWIENMLLGGMLQMAWVKGGKWNFHHLVRVEIVMFDGRVLMRKYTFCLLVLEDAVLPAFRDTASVLRVLTFVVTVFADELAEWWYGSG
ncbi:hypothetical protein EUX98_g7783 [Antrodiella citrinella]|uniref:Uncharacterized protein n=1 Tax=Antrodiella citrinella TaxID=2447956 RepID=A0A4S4MSS6_9APHY|nr:hypothetical protein EUX98_g7783 [Antrodiella citrinella]